MRATVRFRRSALAAAVSLGLTGGLAGNAIAGDIPGHVFTSPADDRMAGAQYFIDFRARRGAKLGHTFIAYGRLGAAGRLLDVEYAGNYPVDEVGLVVGMIIPVPTSIGPAKGDMTNPATIIYRRKLTAAQFARVKAAVRHLRKTERLWHLMFFNCNELAVEVARGIGLRSPPSWMVPHAYVTALRALNDR